MNRSLLTTATLVFGFSVSLLACGGATLDGSPLDEEVVLRATADPLPGSLLAKDLINVVNYAKGQCIGPNGFRSDSGAAMAPSSCDQRAFIDFTLTALPGGNYKFQNYYSKKCLGIAGADSSDGAKVTQQDCADLDNQAFRAVEIRTNVFELRAVHSNKCMDLDAWGNVQQWSCWGGSNQYWKLQVAPKTEIQVINGPLDASRKKCLDTDGSSHSDGGTVQQWDCWGGINQQWFVVRFDDGTVELKPRHSGMCLAIRDAGLDNGTLAEQWTCDGSPSRRFTLTSAGGKNYVVKSKHVGKCLDRPGVTNPTNGALIQQWACSGGVNQSWIFAAL